MLVKKHGFTLVELMAVLTILGLLAAVAVPVVFNSIESAKDNAGESGMAQIEALLNQFYLEEDEYPPTLMELQEKGYTQEIPRSGSGKEYLYTRVDADKYNLQNPD